jgi:hypothetical protein
MRKEKVRGYSFDKLKNRWRVRQTTGKRKHAFWVYTERLARVLAIVFVEQQP